MSAPDRELSSWKEIANYLGISVRTAQDWERTRGLPVRRLPGPRSPVSARVAELDTWKNATGAPAQGAPEQATPAPLVRQRSWTWVVVGALVLLTTALAGAAWRLTPGTPVSYRVERNRLTILDRRGNVVWHRELPEVNVDAYARRDLVWIGVLNGEPSVVIALAPLKADGESGLICYGRDGRQRWRFTPGRTVTTRVEQFIPRYTVQQFSIAPLGQDGQTRVLVVSDHYLYYPCQVALLDTKGTVLREYWHSGHFDHALLADGGRRVLLGGISNAAKSATLVMLDPQTMGGASVEDNSDYQLQGFSPGTEVRRLLFPRSDLNQRLEPFARVNAVLMDSDEITVDVEHRASAAVVRAPVHYHLRPDLALSQMVVGSGFEQVHAELHATHVLDHALSERELSELRQIRLITSSGGGAR